MFNAEIGFVIKDEFDQKFIGLNNHHLKTTLNINEGEGKVTITIDKFPLYGDKKIALNWYFGDTTSDYQIVEDAFQLTLKATDFLGTGRMLDSAFNLIVPTNIQYLQ